MCQLKQVFDKKNVFQVAGSNISIFYKTEPCRLPVNDVTSSDMFLEQN